MGNTPSSVPARVATRRGVTDHYYDRPEDLLEALRPRHDLWEGQAQRWLYRGHADAEWDLQPTGIRDPQAYQKVGVALAHSSLGQEPWAQRAQLQIDMLRTFRDRLNASGLHLPTPEPPVSGLDEGSETVDGLPPRGGRPLLALAQHFGLPTTMLDWTRRGWVAAYFAAADAASAVKRPVCPSCTACATCSHAASVPGSLAVWAMHRKGLAPDGQGDRGALLYTAPSYSNPNMHAQAGIVTISIDADGRSLDRMLQDKGVLTRLILPTSAAPALLRMLHEEGVDGASLFPGTNGVVKAMKESTLWDVPPAAFAE